MTGASADAWRQLADGNDRFASGASLHPRQDESRRAEVVAGQHPVAAILGCSDSRAVPEVVFDQGLGDVFTVRNAGQVADAAAIASLEYAVAVLGSPLIVVLSHESCGAVRAAIDADLPDAAPLPPLIALHIGLIRPSVVPGADAETAGHAHLQATAAFLLDASELIAAAVADGGLAIVGAEYRLSDGRVHRRFALGDAG